MNFKHLIAASLLTIGAVASTFVHSAETAAAALPVPVQAVMNRRQLPNDSLSVVVVDVESDGPALVHNGDVARNPASVMKLVTTLVALDLLGPAYRWKTEIWLRGELDDGILDGDLLLKGHGDPYLVKERVWLLMRDLRSRGLRRIGGDLLIDDSYFDIGNYDPSAFDRQPLRSYNVAPNAMMLNFKTTRYHFEPAASGNGVVIHMDPPLDNLEIVNRLTLRQGACRGYQRGVAIIPNEDYDRMTFSGRFPSGCQRYAMSRAALGHNEFTYGMFRSLWREAGGELDGGMRNIVFEPGEDEEPFLVFDSQPLADVVSRVNKYSNNVMARHLLLTVAAEMLGAPGTESAGRAAVDQWLTERGIDNGSFELSNGAGLSRTARVTARQLAEMLRYAYRQPYMPEYLASMSLVGLDGTTSRRFRSDDPVAGKAHMKTGSLDHVSAIAGYVHAVSGRRYAVAVLQNFPDVHRGYGDEVQAAVLRWVQGL